MQPPQQVPSRVPQQVPFLVRGMSAGDWPAVAAIWAGGIATGHATFEIAPPSWEEFDATRAPHLRLVAEEPTAGPAGSPGILLGWAAAGPVSSRRVYAGVAEHSVYVDPAARGRGVGRALLGALADAADVSGTWTLRSGVFPENAASLRLHARCGFREIGVAERVGRRDGRWRDVVLLERRSSLIGDDGTLVRVALPSRPDPARPDPARPDPATAGPAQAGEDLPAVRELLRASGLPDAGLEEAWRVWVADADGTGGQVVGSAAFERYGDTFLLRSVAVSPEVRGGGLGASLVRAALRSADLEVGGQAVVCLLTETAEGWFDRFGFRPATREELPPEVMSSPQLSGGLCPASARAFLR